MTTLKGQALDEAIEKELILITNEGLVQEITPTLVHNRLKSKGVVQGQVSTLSTPSRKALINKYNLQLLNGLGLTPVEEGLILSRNSKVAFMQRIQKLQAENDELKDQLQKNTYTMLTIIKMLKTETRLPIEEVLSPYLLSKLEDDESNNG
ncbi:hypothetical protein BCT40_10380 [Vibrio lentus]|uniref:hypothetical protein n=1 Tax=Vibrio lentus TaxID=136468 RepID=UPI000C854D53|nr:hypothetical protein [Vibrio lentus]PMG54148.1 hypothetical protein BCU87_24765 [Vibrio lentus]PMM97689.1 hypothetical protein BCT40_10380 [Vibrio lentus]